MSSFEQNRSKPVLVAIVVQQSDFRATQITYPILYFLLLEAGECFNREAR